MMEGAKRAFGAGNGPEKPYRKLRAFVGFVVIVAFEAAFIYKWIMNARIDSLWIVVQVVIVVASVIAVYGAQTFSEAQQSAQELTESSE